MSIGNVSKIELVSLDSDTTFVTDISKGFKINSNAQYDSLESAMLALNTLTINTYSDTILTQSVSLNAVKEFAIVPEVHNFENLQRSIITTENTTTFQITKGIYSGNSTTANLNLRTGFLIGNPVIKNFTTEKTSASGSLMILGYTMSASSQTRVAINYTSAWEGTYDDSEAYIEWNWYPYHNGTKQTVRVPFKVIILEE